MIVIPMGNLLYSFAQHHRGIVFKVLLGLHPLSKCLIEPLVRLVETNCTFRHSFFCQVSKYTHLFKLLCVRFLHSYREPTR